MSCCVLGHVAVWWATALVHCCFVLSRELHACCLLCAWAFRVLCMCNTWVLLYLLTRGVARLYQRWQDQLSSSAKRQEKDKDRKENEGFR